MRILNHVLDNTIVGTLKTKLLLYMCGHYVFCIKKAFVYLLLGSFLIAMGSCSILRGQDCNCPQWSMEGTEDYGDLKLCYEPEV